MNVHDRLFVYEVEHASFCGGYYVSLMKDRGIMGLVHGPVWAEAGFSVVDSVFPGMVK